MKPDAFEVLWVPPGQSEHKGTEAAPKAEGEPSQPNCWASPSRPCLCSAGSGHTELTLSGSRVEDGEEAPPDSAQRQPGVLLLTDELSVGPGAVYPDLQPDGSAALCR
ncbi:hypothetical protein AAFF_G00154900 [Aldrovandia affinis]|uniref:Uncharacterized protein n=1 Tax=Aldrovandia affinis TaxID=143900 RepID=A0AAD7WWJ2_9TELE|nr:hypothetical protein AAFF_G00154900 [Aldrovandia affinis]